MTLEQVFELILGNLGVLVLLLFILLGGFRRWWVWGWYAEELKQQNKEYRSDIKQLEQRLDRATRVAEVSVAVGEQATGLVARAEQRSFPQAPPPSGS